VGEDINSPYPAGFKKPFRDSNSFSQSFPILGFIPGINIINKRGVSVNPGDTDRKIRVLINFRFYRQVNF
jgi:hypothetical protein